MTRCVDALGVDATGVTATRAGSRSICAARSAISRGMVAENSSVCRSFGSFATIVRMSWMKPMSSMRSASSSTSTSTWLRRTPFDAQEVEQAAGRRDQHVEAVHQVAHLAAHRHAADDERGLDAHVAAIGAEAFEDLAGKFARRAEHQHARALLLERLPVGGSRLRIGSANAAVLPVPVCAMPTRSRPARTSGMASVWIGVGVEYCSSARARMIGSARPKSLNEVKGYVLRVARRPHAKSCRRMPRGLSRHPA